MKGPFGRSKRSVGGLAASLATIALVLAACGGSPQGSPPASKPHKMTTVHVDLNWVPNVEFSGLWVALKKGWFNNAGLKLKGLCSTSNCAGVRPYDFHNTPESETDLCTHTTSVLCLGFDDSSAIPIARQAGELLTGIWAGSQKTPFGFMTCYVPPKPKVNKGCKSNTGKNITSPKQWSGLKIGYQQDELYVPELMLGSVGKSLSDVKPQQVGFDPSVLTAGTVDAYLVFINNEPLQLQLKGIRTNVMPAYQYGMKPFYADVMYAPERELTKYGSQIKTFVHLVDKGWKWSMHHPVKAAKMIVKHYFTDPTEGGGPKGLKQQKLEIHQFATTLSRNKAGKVDGQMTLPRWKKIVKDLKTYPGSLGGQPIITAKIKPKDCFTDKFAPAPSV